jgi:glycosyltransferase involved in cell wall biosynthesis
LVKKLDIEDMVIWSGFRQDMPHVLNAIDIYTLPSLWEGLPIGLLSNGNGKTYCCHGRRWLKEVVKDGINGTLIECGDDEGLANALLSCIKTKLKWLNLAKSREIILTTYTVDRMCREVEAIYLQQL